MWIRKWLSTIEAAALLALLPGGRAAAAQPLPFGAPFLLEVSAPGEDPAALYREARDLIDNQDWPEAERKLAEYLQKDPRARYADAALYYLAFTLKKQARFAEADKSLLQLLRDFPRSGWSEDAYAMRVEIGVRLGNSKVVEEALAGDDEQNKAPALQALLRQDPPRALESIAAVLKPESGASDRLRELCLLMLARFEGPGAGPIMTDFVRQSSNTKLQRLAIAGLGSATDPPSVAFLRELAFGESGELAFFAVHVLTQNPATASVALLEQVARQARTARARQVAACEIALALKGHPEQRVAALRRLYLTSPDLDVRKVSLIVLTAINTPQAWAVLEQAARSTDRPEARALARYYLAPRGSSQRMRALLDWYDLETNNELRLNVLYFLGEFKQTREARAKLTDVAENSPVQSLREQANAILTGVGSPRTIYLTIEGPWRQTSGGK